MMTISFTRIIFLAVSLLFLSSCGKNIMKGSFFTADKITSSQISSIQGYWKSNKFKIDTTGDINQNIFNTSELNLAKSDRSNFDDQLKTHECSEVKEHESFTAIEAEIHVFFHYEQYYMVANLTYTTENGDKLRCSGDLGQGDFISDADNYYFLEDLNLGIKLEKQNSGNMLLKFLR